MDSSIVRWILCAVFIALYRETGRGWPSASADVNRQVRSETTVMTYLPPLSSSLKHKRPNGQKSFHFIADDRDYIIDLQRYYPIGDIRIEYDNARREKNSSFLNDADPLYQGIVRTDETASFAFGRFMDTGHFFGYIRMKDTYFVEPAGFANDKKLLIKFYKFSDALYPGCEDSYYFVYCKAGFDYVHATTGVEMRKLQLPPKKPANLAINRHLLSFGKTNKTMTGNISAYENGTSETPFVKKLHKASSNYSQVTAEGPSQSFSNQSFKASAKLQNYTGVHEVQSSLQNESETSITTSSTFDSSTAAHNNKPRRKILPQATEDLKSFSCEVDVVADYSFLKKHKMKKRCMLAEIYAIIAFIDQYLRMVDFDADKNPDDIGLVLKKIAVFTDEKKSIFYTPKTSTVNWDTYLEEITKWKVRSQNHASCLTIVMAHKDVVGGALGYSGHSKLCDSRLSKNVIFLTTSTGHLVQPTAINFLSGLVYVAGAFGVNIGPVKAGKTSELMDCIKKSRFRGYYYGSYADILFNDCTMSKVNSVLGKAECLVKSATSTCGDGIKDVGEECDCGPASVCKTVDPCCTKDCRIKANYNCSHEFPCCDKSCFPVTAAAKRKCGNEGAICNFNVCDGENAECPEPPQSFEGKHCLTEIDTIDAMTCVEGRCIAPMCAEVFFLKPCRCRRGSGYECHNCCVDKKNGECLSIKDGFRAEYKGSPYLRPANSSCFQKGKHCTSMGTCEAISEAVDNEPSFVPIVLFTFISCLTLFAADCV